MEKGDILYKYRSFNDQSAAHAEDLFLYNRIYFPCPDQFNDPFDCRINFSLDGSKEEWRKYLRRAYKQARPEFSVDKSNLKIEQIIRSGEYMRLDPTITHQINQGVGILCLSVKLGDILMWSHYADKHTGFVVEFRAEPGDDFFKRAKPVKYQAEYPTTRVFDSYEERMQTAMLTKSIHWAYEEEYRIIEHEHGPGTYTFPDHLLTGVIFGCQMPDERKFQIRNWLNQRRVQPRVYEARKKDREFSLSIEIAP